jgi:tetratricopeptide (TPR) repeat protein
MGRRQREAQLLGEEESISPREALQFAKAAYAEKQRPGRAIALANAHIAVGEFDAADAVMEDAVVRWPDDRRLLMKFARFDQRGLGYAAAAERIDERIAANPQHPGLYARAAMIALATNDDDRYVANASQALALAAPEVTPRLRKYLAAGAVDADRNAAADQVMNMAWPSDASPEERLFENLRIRIVRSSGDEDFEAQLEGLAAAPEMRAKSALLMNIFRWFRDGPTWALAEGLEAAHDIDILGPASAVGIAHQLGGLEAAEAIFLRHPGLTEHWRKWLLVARLAAPRGVPEAQELADLFDHVELETAALLKRLGDPAVSIAVVGNSPCEVGQGRGEEIDRHQEVIRFNDFSTASAFRPDYGSRTTMVCRLGFQVALDTSALEPGAVIHLRRPNQLYRRFDWQRLAAVRREGFRITCHPWEGYVALRKRVAATPSSGLAMCQLLKSLRGHVKREDFFGFSFVGQNDAQTSHYTKKGVASKTHNWEGELAYFQSLFDDDA